MENRIRCLLIDDEPIALEKMCNYVAKIPYLELVAACDNHNDATSVLSKENVDVIFTDINIPGMNGLDFVASLSKLPLVVFITSYSDYAIDSYKLGAIDYILKPYGFMEFQRAAERVRQRYDTALLASAGMSKDSIFIRTDYKWIHVKTEDIRYIQGMSDYVSISVEGFDAPLVTYATFSGIKESLPSEFIQVHRSWTVNPSHIKVIERSVIITDNGTHIPVGDSFKESLKCWLGSRSIGKTNAKNKI